jgi:hypothetical protein
VGNLFDKLAKDAAADLPRRQAVRLVGGALLGVVLAAVGLSADSKKDKCEKACNDCCKTFDFPPRSAEHGKCMSECHQGRGDCGPLACPADDPQG